MQCLGLPRACTSTSTSFLRLRVWKDPRRNTASRTIALKKAMRVTLFGQLHSGGSTSTCAGRQYRAAPERSTRVNAVDDEQRASEIEVREVVTAEDTEIAPAEDDTAPRLPWIALLALLGVFVSNQWSRALVYYINNFDPPAGMEPAEAARRFANIDLGYGEQQYALLASFGFTAVFAAASLVAGRLADKQDRAFLTVVTCLLWSAASAAGGCVQSFEGLLVSRALTGLAQAATAPAAYSLIADLAPPSMIATSNSIYASGIYIGGALASLGVPLDEVVGWRGAKFLVAGIGVVAAGVAYVLVPEPRRQAVSSGVADGKGAPRGATEKAEKVRSGDEGEEVAFVADFVSSLHKILVSPTVRWLLLAAGVRFCAGFGLAVWKGPFFLGKFPDQAESFGIINAAIVGLGGGASVLIGGRLADSLASESRNPAQARLQVPVYGSLLAAPLMAGTLLSDTLEASLMFLLLEYLVAECWFGPTIAAIFAALPDPALRGTTQGSFALLTAFGNTAPLLIAALLTDQGIAGTGVGANMPLQDAMLWVICGAYVLSGLVFAKARSLSTSNML